MKSIIKKALPGSDPGNAGTALGIESKAVFKYTHFLGHLLGMNFEVLVFAGMEAYTS
jgi:hypothetical protein